MSDQLTLCPHCQTSFRVTPTQLKAAGGLVRCGSCLGLFSATINFIRVKPDAWDDPEEEAATDLDEYDDTAETSDDILLGDLDLDSLPLVEDEPRQNAAADDDADDESSEEGILFADPRPAGRAAPEDYVLYEEYEDAPDLLANLDTAPDGAGEANEASAIPAAVTDAAPAAEAALEDTEEETEEPLDSPSEDFEPHGMLFDDDEDDEIDEADEDEFEDFDAEPDAGHSPADEQEPGSARGLEPVFDDALIDDMLFDEPDLDELLDEEMDEDDIAAGEDPALAAREEFTEDEEEFAEDEEEFDDEDEGLAAGDFGEPAAEAYDEYDDAPADDLADDASTAADLAALHDNFLTDAQGRRQPGFGDAEADAEAILEEWLDDLQEEPEVEVSAAGDHYEEYQDAPAPAANAAPAAAKPAWLRQQDDAPPGKAALHGYLATLEDEDELEPLDQDSLDEFDDEPVMLATGKPKRGLLATTGLALVALLLVGALALQFVDRHLEALRQRSSFARFEPWACALLDCPPAPQPVAPESSTLYSQELLIRTHPRIRGALELSFIFRNDADADQPFPGLELSFKDRDNQLLANRLLLPGDYLPAELRLLDAMPARSSVQVMLELVDPGANAVNYTIAFRDL